MNVTAEEIDRDLKRIIAEWKSRTARRRRRR
jgi:hypothetical protein